MCGIAGIISKHAPLANPSGVGDMLATQKHRGPDGTGAFRGEFFELGMVRLAIIDLKSDNLCPMVYSRPRDSSVTHVLSYNGEIYNYRELKAELQSKGHVFVTTSDTEVLLHSYLEWGEACLDRFNGMFAFGLADLEKDILFLARDIAGEKPLYYFEDSERFLFASEIKALLPLLPKPEANITDEFKAFEYVTGSETLFKGVYALRPGHKMVVRGIKGKFENCYISEYWSLANNLYDVDPAKAVDILDELLHDAVNTRLRADVKLGLYLSGGIDSSLLACLAKPPIVFSVTSDYGPKYNELPFAQSVAHQIGAEHIVIKPTKKEFEENIDRVLYHLDMPTGSFSSFPLYMLAREASRHVKIVLSGEGADELFSGYTRYILPNHEFRAYDIPELANYHSLLDFYYGNKLGRFAHLINRGAVSDEVVKEIINPYFSEFSDLRHAMGYTEFKLMLITLLHMEDRAAAAFGIENRTPFLDKNVIRFAFSIPGDLKIKGNTTKWVLREVAKRYVPKLIMDRTDKLGLISPINIWMNFTGQRGEFDRRSYNRLCMDKWKNIFFDGGATRLLE